MRIPRIGITCDRETAIDRRGCPSPRHLIGDDYVDSVTAAGGDPILVPNRDLSRVEAYLAIIDGLVISGGEFDVPPAFYREESRYGMGNLQQERSAWEQALLKAALANDMPVLGICGGMQLLNVHLGGTLYQDLSERPDTLKHEQPQDKHQPDHEVSVTEGSLLAEVTQTMRLEVNSTHHQLVREVPCLALICSIAPDGVIEAIEVPSHRFVLGVQWHPESLRAPAHQRIYGALIEAAKHGTTGQ